MLNSLFQNLIKWSCTFILEFSFSSKSNIQGRLITRLSKLGSCLRLKRGSKIVKHKIITKIRGSYLIICRIERG